jgi:hypothetical protein
MLGKNHLIASFKGKVDRYYIPPFDDSHGCFLEVSELVEMFWTPWVLIPDGINCIPMQLSPVPLQGDIP